MARANLIVVDALIQSSLTGLNTAFIALKVAVPSTPPAAFLLLRHEQFYGVEDEHQRYCQVTGCQFVVTKPTKKFDLHLISKHIDGGLRWYCGNLKCKELSWCGMDKKSIRKHVETVHSEGAEEAWRKCVLLHPKTLDDHLQSRKDLK